MSSRRMATGISLALFIGICSVGQVQSAITVKVDTILFTNNLKYHGVNWVGNTTWFIQPTDNPACKEALDSMGVQIIRYPGGVPGEYFAWKNPGTGYVAPQAVWNFANSLHSKPQVMFQTNASGSGTPTTSYATTGPYVADWVTWADTNKMNVLFEVGNEDDLNMTGSTPQAKAANYFPVFNTQSDSMHHRLSTTKVGGPAFANDYYWGANTNNGQLNLLQTFLTNCDIGNRVDFVTLHWYDQPGATSGYAELKNEFSKWPLLMSQSISSKTKKPVYLTEWSVLGPTMDNVNNDWNKTMGGAIGYADVIGTLCKVGIAGHTMFGCIYGVDDNWGLLCGSNEYRDPNSPTPSFYALALWCKMGNLVLKNSNTNSVTYSAYAQKKTDGSVQVMCINKAGVTKSETISFTGGFDPTGKVVNIYEIKPNNTVNDGTTDSAAQNIYYNGVAVPAAAFNGATHFAHPTTTTCAGSTFARDLPPYSITMMDFNPSNVAVKPGASGALNARTDLAVSLSRMSGGQVAISLPSTVALLKPAVSVYAISGELVARIGEGTVRGAGSVYNWNASTCKSGSYLVRVDAGDKAYAATCFLTK